MELLHSQAYLQAVLQFVTHTQALFEKEHQLLGRPMITGAQQGLQHDPPADVSTTCHATNLQPAVQPHSIPPSLAPDHVLHLSHTHSPAGAQASHEQVIPPMLLCTAQGKLLEAAWTIVQCRQKQDLCPAVSQASARGMPTCMCPYS